MVRRNHTNDDEVTLDPKDLDLPAKPRLVKILVEPYVDCGGDAALEVWLVMADSTPEKHMDFDHTEPIRERIRSLLRERGEDRFPYFRTRKVSEMRRRRG